MVAGNWENNRRCQLALHLQKQNRSCLMVATDVYRPAAIDQLVTLGKQIQVPVFEGSDADPGRLPDRRRGQAEGVDTIIIDTAGRLQIDQDMMAELARIKQTVQPMKLCSWWMR